MTRLKFAAAGLSAAALSLTVAASAGVAMASPSPSAAAHVASAHVTPASSKHSHRSTSRRHYRVQAGDSFWTIAHQTHTDWYNLAADNGLHMYSVLAAGQVLVLPRAGEAPHAPLPLTAPDAAVAPAASTTSSDQASAPAETAPSTSASTSTTTSGDSSFEQCVISRESGGDANASNGSHWGLYQFSPGTWAAYGGSSGDYGSASASEQQQVFDNAIAQGGESNWAPYDGC